MLEPHPARDPVAARGSRVGLALAGGGPLGAIYELGALCALDEAFEGVDFTDLTVYVGVSSGGFLAASLANQITPVKMCQIFIDNIDTDHPFTPELFLKPAFAEYFKRASTVPKLLIDALWRFIRNPCDLGLLESFNNLGQAIPTGIFDNETINKALTEMYTYQHRTNDFRQLKNKLYIVAADLDTGEAIRFGAPGYDHVPISRAVQASAALPGLFPPVEIDGRSFVDGALLKTLHASVALDEGADLVICVNPLVPFDASLAAQRGGSPKHSKLVQGGLPLVLSQTFRAIIHSRMQVGMSKYDSLYEDADVLLFEPNRDDAEMFFTNVFSYASRHRLCEHAYQTTRRELLARSDQLETILARHNIKLRVDILQDKTRHVSTKLVATELQRPTAKNSLKLTYELSDSLDELQQWLESQKRPKIKH
ncbi:MAG: patatin [Beggiatoa sp. IS2]|nr:MAG: patatin [Beggiatoa sp. IS2]